MAVDETRWAAWDSTPSVSSRAPKRPRARVKSNWLRRAVPASEEIEESARALKLVAETTLEHCFEALLSSRGEMPDAPTSVKKLHIAWDHLLKKTYRKCAESVLNELGQVKLQPLYPEMQVQEEFLCNRKALESVTTYTYHGTKQQNIESISKVGLLMPGTGGHTVKNGSAHGVGIYTARLGRARLSRGFCDSDQMFLCGVCDTSMPVTTNETEEQVPKWTPSSTYVQTQFPKRPPATRRPVLQKYEVHRKSEEVIHVGDAVVTFKPNMAVPLFLISDDSNDSKTSEKDGLTASKVHFATEKKRPELPSQTILKHHSWVPDDEDNWALPQKVATRQLAVPESDEGKLIRFGKNSEGRTVWVVEDPWALADSKERSLKRRHLARQRDRQRQLARLDKRQGSWLWQ